MEENGGEERRPIFRDIRRYYCEYCGICRSKKTLITSHILAHHQEEMNMEESDAEDKVEGNKRNTCEECGASFKKPAHLKQHMQSHSLERPFMCSVDDCTARYRRNDHLNRHLLTHKGKLFKCPVGSCNLEFSVRGNMTRHMKELHCNDGGDGYPSTSSEDKQHHVCQEKGCGKVFKYPSKLRKHADSHVWLESVEAFCSEPDCMKCFTNEECLRAHVKSCHQYIKCDICGAKQLKKNIKRHLRGHEGCASLTFKCSVEDCSQMFSTASNLHKHIKAVHEDVRPFVCGFTGCGKRFAYKHVRDKHEKSGCHVYTCGDFVELDEEFRSRPRGGQKRIRVSAEMLVRKRVMPPSPADPTK